MSDFQAIADRVETEALRGEFTDAAMMRDRDRMASLFTHDRAADARYPRRAGRPGGDPRRGESGRPRLYRLRPLRRVCRGFRRKNEPEASWSAQAPVSGRCLVAYAACTSRAWFGGLSPLTSSHM
jgi:hypothetical protein